MLNPETFILPAIVAALQSNIGLVAALNEDASRISSFKYLFGIDSRLDLAVNAMKAPSILVAWDATQPGNFSGSQIWKHYFSIYIRLANQALAPQPYGYGDIWAQIVNGPIKGGTQNIRNVELALGLDLMDTPGIIHLIDEDRMDLFKGSFVMNEIGDN